MAVRIPPPRRWRPRLFALLVMLLGAWAVFALVIIMNQYLDKPGETDGPSSTSLVVRRPPPPKPKPRARPLRRKRPAKPKHAPRLAAPNLAAGLSGLDVGLPDVDSFKLGGVADTLLGDASDMVMTEDAVDERPKARSRATLTYPPRARSKGVEGYVTVNLLIGRDGRVERLRVLESEPPGVFEQAATEALRQWEFEPARYKEQNVKVWARQTIRFQLK